MAPALINQGKYSECSVLHFSSVKLYMEENNSSVVFLFVAIVALVRALICFGSFERGVLLFFMRI